MKYPVALTCGALWLASVSSLAWAADVPPGTVLAEKQQFTGRILAVGINYDKETKQHRCKVEEIK